MLRVAKEAGAEFSFASNTRLLRVPTPDYCVEMAREVPLTKADMFTPPRAGNHSEGPSFGFDSSSALSTHMAKKGRSASRRLR